MSMMSRRFGRVRAAFTLVELLVVIGIIALLISILLPSLNRARVAALDIKCASNLRQMVMLSQIYLSEYRDYMPPGQSEITAGKLNYWPEDIYASNVSVYQRYLRTPVAPLFTSAQTRAAVLAAGAPDGDGLPAIFYAPSTFQNMPGPSQFEANCGPMGDANWKYSGGYKYRPGYYYWRGMGPRGYGGKPISPGQMQIPHPEDIGYRGGPRGIVWSDKLLCYNGAWTFNHTVPNGTAAWTGQPDCSKLRGMHAAYSDGSVIWTNLRNNTVIVNTAAWQKANCSVLYNNGSYGAYFARVER